MRIAGPLLQAIVTASAEPKQLAAAADPAVDLVAVEKDKIKGAVRTDFILSAEIIAITLGTVATSPFAMQVAVLTGIALIMTVGVYGLVAGIVKLDDAGLYLSQRQGANGFPAFQRKLGALILRAAPYLMKSLSVLGMAAMFMVGGGILTHGIHSLHELIEHAAHNAGQIPVLGGILQALTPTFLDAVVGVIAGALVLGAVSLVGRIWRKGKSH